MEDIESKSLIKKRLIVFALVAYGISFLMMIPMYIGKKNGMDLTQIVDAQMCSPAAGVALGYLMFYKGEKRVPKMFMIVLVINYVIQLVLGLLSIFANPFTADDVINLAQAAGPASDDVTALAGSQSVLKLQQIYLLLGELALMGCSILLWIGYFTAGRERRKFAGLSRNNEGKGALLILLFVGLYCLRIFVPMIAEGLLTNTMREYGEMYAGILKNPLFYLSIISLPINYPLLIIAFLGEEYGWRHFLQPIMQKKFGMKLGVILLGVVWGLWHIPVDTMYYTQDSVPQMIIGQIITCISIGIFFGYAYLKTNNIWVPVCMHFLNNNLIPILTGEFTAEVLEDQHVPWEYLIEILIIDFLVFCLFIFAKEYKEKKKTKEALDA
jgi:membrane protease YdiL (CAAX protease family)